MTSLISMALKSVLAGTKTGCPLLAGELFDCKFPIHDRHNDAA
jgi:hypothetical protein